MGRLRARADSAVRIAVLTDLSGPRPDNAGTSMRLEQRERRQTALMMSPKIESGIFSIVD